MAMERKVSVVRERQAALRVAYTARPDDAVVDKWACTTGPPDPFHGTVHIGQSRGAVLRYGIDRAVGGLHDAANPGDLLCAALAACADGTIRMVAELLGVGLDELRVEVTGRVDVRGTLAIDPAVRAGFDALTCRVYLRPAPGTDPDLVSALLLVAERASVNLDTLRRGTPVDFQVDAGTRRTGSP